MTKLISDVTALGLALHDERCDCSGLDLKRYADRAEGVAAHLARNGWYLVHSEEMVGRIAGTIMALAEHDQYDLQYTREVTRLARDVADALRGDR
jgi:hypothetical protein